MFFAEIGGGDSGLWWWNVTAAFTETKAVTAMVTVIALIMATVMTDWVS